MSQNNEEGILDWDDLSEPDQIKAQQLLTELNNLFNKYSNPEGKVCEDSTLDD